MINRYKVYVEIDGSASGMRRNGVVYPMFSRITPPVKIAGGENIKAEQELKITIMDGTFELASKRIGYTGQHTDLYASINIINAEYNCSGELNQCDKPYSIYLVTNDNPYIYGKIYSRNKYGGKRAFFRLDLETAKIQRPIKRADKITWHNFSPSEYID
jgi:hypothetical protein